MAQTYKISGANITSAASYSNIYTCPNATTSIINSAYLGNTGAGDTSATLKLTDDSESESYQIITNILVPEQASLLPLSAPLVLEQNDSLSVQDASGFLDVVVNVLEIT